ncbi:uncharacterized protein LOC115325428 [Ixodes scapularis]|uniref:uncharacterized protein LOC115325428 n=1 Tax=Ixodes scapularis TaxID=6945 RepID=UPI001AD6E25D|nr:uncharacterized protein LOC115325428 [Ixodes scapularis]
MTAASLESTAPAFSGRWVPQQDDISPVHAASTDRGSRHMGLQRSSPHGGTPRRSKQAEDTAVQLPTQECAAPVTRTTLPPGHATSQMDPQVFAFMERILCVMNSIKLTQQTHTQLLVELRTNVELPGTNSQGLPDLPFMTLRDLLEWDEEIKKSKEAQLRMKKHMIVQGGDNVKEKTTSILKSLLTWKVAMQITWFGTKGKRKFIELNICKLLCSTLVDCDGSVAENVKRATLKDIEKAGMSWFRHATERAAGEDRALAATTSPTAADAGTD